MNQAGNLGKHPFPQHYRKAPPTPGSGERGGGGYLGKTGVAEPRDKSRKNKRGRGDRAAPPQGKGRPEMAHEGIQGGNAISCYVPRFVHVPPSTHIPPSPRLAQHRACAHAIKRADGKPQPNTCHPQNRPCQRPRHHPVTTPQPWPKPRNGQGRAAAPRSGARIARRATCKGARLNAPAHHGGKVRA